jgi:hypothetical protein
MRFDPKISTLEERADLSTISMDELHKIFKTYEMRTVQENPSTKEASFKESRRTKKKKNPESKPNCSYSDDSYEDEEMGNFVRKLKKGTKKYKGMLPLKCFDCDKIGHFVNKCPMLRSKIVMKRKIPRKKINIKRETRKIKGKYSRKTSTQEKTILHPMKMMKEIVTHREFSLWLQKIRKAMKKLKWILKHN